jgi:hypothetical protein
MQRPGEGKTAAFRAVGLKSNRAALITTAERSAAASRLQPVDTSWRRLRRDGADAGPWTGDRPPPPFVIHGLGFVPVLALFGRRYVSITV